MTRYLMLFLIAVSPLIIRLTILADCPYECPHCYLEGIYFEEDPVLETLTRVCISAGCDFMPWCFEIIGHGTLAHLKERVEVTEANMEFPTAPNIRLSVRDGIATACISGFFEFAFIIPGLSGEAAIIKLPLGFVNPGWCLGACPCSGGFTPFVWLGEPKKMSHHMLDIPVHASDPDGDLCSVRYDGGFFHGKITWPEQPVPMIAVLYQLVSSCEDHIYYESTSCEPSSDAIWAVAEDGKGHVYVSNPRGLTMPVNVPPDVKISEISPESLSLLLKLKLSGGRR